MVRPSHVSEPLATSARCRGAQSSGLTAQRRKATSLEHQPCATNRKKALAVVTPPTRDSCGHGPTLIAAQHVLRSTAEREDHPIGHRIVYGSAHSNGPPLRVEACLPDPSSRSPRVVRPPIGVAFAADVASSHRVVRDPTGRQLQRVDLAAEGGLLAPHAQDSRWGRRRRGSCSRAVSPPHAQHPGASNRDPDGGQRPRLAALPLRHGS